MISSDSATQFSRISQGIETWGLSKSRDKIEQSKGSSTASHSGSSVIDVGVGIDGSTFAIMNDPMFDQVKKLFKLDSSDSWIEFTTLPNID